MTPLLIVIGFMALLPAFILFLAFLAWIESKETKEAREKARNKEIAEYDKTEYLVDGKIYDIKTAEEVASQKRTENDGCCEYPWYTYYVDILYKTKKDAWFMITKEKSHFGSKEGSSCKVLTNKTALHWLEEHNSIAEVNKHFDVVMA